MPTLLVKYPAVLEKETQKVSKELLWYDSEHQVMRKFNGGKLEYEYKFDETLDPPQYRLLPKVADVEEVILSKRIDKTAVPKWFNQYENYNHTAMEVSGQDSDGIEFEVPSDELEDVLYDLHRRGYEYVVR